MVLTLGGSEIWAFHGKTESETGRKKERVSEERQREGDREGKKRKEKNERREREK
jgi:hypothetical protein